METEVHRVADDKLTTGAAESLVALARSRARLYENIGKIKGNIASLATEDSSEQPEPSEEEVAALLELGGEAAQLASLREERDALRKAVKVTEDALLVSEEARAGFLEKKVRLRAETEQIRHERDEALRKLSNLEHKFDRVRQKTEAAFIEQEKQRKELEATVEQLSQACARVETRSRNREEDIGRLEKEIGWMKSDVLSMAGDAAKTVEELQQATVERDARIWTLEERLEEAAAISIRIKPLEAERDSLEARLLTSMRERDQFEQKIEEVSGQLKSEEQLACELGSARGDIAALQGEREGLHDRLVSLQRERDKLAMLRVAGRKRLDTVEAENKLLREELDKTAANLNEVKRLIKAIEEAGL